MSYLAMFWLVSFALGAAEAPWAAVPFCGLAGCVAYGVVCWRQIAFDLRLGQAAWLRTRLVGYLTRCAEAGAVFAVGRLAAALLAG